MTPLAITPGDPGGIGPDLCIQAAADGELGGIVVADPEIIKRRADSLGLSVQIMDADHYNPERTQGIVYVEPVAAADPTNMPGVSDPTNAGYCLQSLEHALQGIKEGNFRALVTGPVNKATIRGGGFESFTGHTEFLRDFFGLPEVVMMLASTDCRVALVTTHLPLAEVPKTITLKRIETVTGIVIKAISDVFQIPQPRIHVLGLNPHAGEDGHLGREELDIIQPALEALRAQNPDVHIEGPLPADTAFTPELRAQADCHIAMYHDQALPVVKYKGFGDSVNITLGLPIVRTSVDHGTALNLAGKGLASTKGLVAAIQEANRLTTSFA
ncbi:MAG: 4-hydroxythreonine-4-phosphate dehydrogenase PdxA [Oceanospirillales bacterium TMED33]|nr:4-hydroxythreonine-4-phosphate dehydrogenase PdxA [Gammaproteobacteria bacterium]RPG22455.1 MAG: 4-hydroxythreonine-4-phosphate dehydrogenase PdxA [Oceanospirillales bacterium TMED33]CAI8311325.1 MAG: 4-hydroxythreonine-4-phosphate dehydrogenase 1 [Gammaproteobacteria bacterium]